MFVFLKLTDILGSIFIADFSELRSDVSLLIEELGEELFFGDGGSSWIAFGIGSRLCDAHPERVRVVTRDQHS